MAAGGSGHRSAVPLSKRYSPEHPPGESCSFGIDFSRILPRGVGIAAAALTIYTNTPGDVWASSDFTVGTVEIVGRTCFAILSGGVEGTDYQLRWTVTDTLGNTWIRTAMVLCAQTS